MPKAEKGQWHLVRQKKTAKHSQSKKSKTPIPWPVSARTHPAKLDPSDRKLTESEVDLLTHMENGYQLETDSLGANPVLRNLKDGEVIRPVSVNRGTIEALEGRGLIKPGKGEEPLTVVWQRTKAK